MMHNPNLIHAIRPHQVVQQEAIETFFQNALWGRHVVNVGDRSCDFVVDGKHRFRILSEQPRRQLSNICYSLDGIRRSDGPQIPLWLFGFLY